MKYSSASSRFHYVGGSAITLPTLRGVTANPSFILYDAPRFQILQFLVPFNSFINKLQIEIVLLKIVIIACSCLRINGCMRLMQPVVSNNSTIFESYMSVFQYF